MKYRGVIETTGSVDAITFASDGAQFVNASGMIINLYDAVTCRKTRDFDVKQSWFALDFSPDDSRVVGGSRGSQVSVLDTATGKELAAFIGHEKTVTGVRFLEDENSVVSGSIDGTLKKWNVKTKLSRSIEVPGGGKVQSMSLSTDRRILVTCQGGFLSPASIVVWNTMPLMPVQTISLPGRADICVISPDGNKVLVAIDQEIVGIDIKTGNMENVMAGHEGFITWLTFDTLGENLMSCAIDGTVRTWDVHGGHMVACERIDGDEQARRLMCCAVSKDGRLLVGTGDSLIHVFDAVEHSCEGVVPVEQVRQERRRLAKEEESRKAEEERNRAAVEEARRREEERRNAEEEIARQEEAERKRAAEEKARQEEATRRERLQEERMHLGKCRYCGERLGVFDRLASRRMHKQCVEFRD